MRNKLFIAVAVATSFTNINSANAVSLSKRLYFHSNLYVGFTEQTYQGDARHFIENAKKNIYTATYQEKGKGIVIGNGSAFYLKLDNVIHLFIGYDIQLRMPRGNTNVYKANGYGFDFKEYGMFNGKLGARINLYKSYIAIAPYCLAGYNVGAMVINRWGQDLLYDYNIGRNYGFGVDFIVGDVITFGFEYRIGTNDFQKYQVQDVDQKQFNKTKIKTKNLMMKVGINFL
jgi:hypothetical protein